MAEIKTVIVPLNGRNYPTWKVQCRMALMKESLWGIISGTEETPGEDNADARRKFMARRDRALAIIVLAVDPSLLYNGRPGGSKSCLEEARGAVLA